MMDSLEILKEIQNLTKISFQIELRVSQLAQTQQFFSDQLKRQNDEIERQKQRLYSFRQTVTTILKYWHPVILYAAIDTRIHERIAGLFK